MAIVICPLELKLKHKKNKNMHHYQKYKELVGILNLSEKFLVLEYGMHPKDNLDLY